jgi:4-carboxymuconolactone decarboxylase
MDQAKYDRGLEVRRSVLGKEYVDARMAELDDFSLDLNQLVTSYAWADIWDRPGLPKKVRSMLCLAMLSALNRPHEIKTHLRGAINNGLTKDEIKEVFLQVAAYCGAPAAVDSFRIARQYFAEEEEKG